MRRITPILLAALLTTGGAAPASAAGVDALAITEAAATLPPNRFVWTPAADEPGRVSVLISIPGALGYIYAGWPRMAEFPDRLVMQPPFAVGYVSMVGLALFIPTSTWFAPVGARLAHRLSKRRLEVAFGIFLLIVCIRFLASLV